MKQTLFLVAVWFAAAGAVASAQIDTGNTGGTQDHSGTGNSQQAPPPVDTGNTGGAEQGGSEQDYSGAGTADSFDDATTIKLFDVCFDRALDALKRKNYLTASHVLNTCLGQDGNPLNEDPAGVVPNEKLAEAYYARGLARARLAHMAGSKTSTGDSAADFKKAEGLDPTVDARMAEKGFPRKR